MALRHNKKRNAGMLGEFFAMCIAESVVSKNHSELSTAKKLWTKHVHPNSELHKEVRLFNALRSKSFESKQVAYDLLSKVKRAAVGLKRERLEREKTSLIREVNEKLGPSFFDKPVKNFTELASIQIWLNYHSEKKLNESVINPAMAELEDKVLGFMTKPSAESEKRSLNEVLSMTNDQVDGLIVNIMREKMNKKFAPRLTEDQKTILQQFVFGNSNEQLKETLEKLRDDTTRLITKELDEHKGTKADKDKLTEIKSLLSEDYHDVSTINETMITFYMTVSKLNDELGDEN